MEKLNRRAQYLGYLEGLRAQIRVLEGCNDQQEFEESIADSRKILDDLEAF